MLPLRRLIPLLAFLLYPLCGNALDQALIEALRGGGYVLYFRHADTDWSQNDRNHDGDWESCDSTRMRQLSDAGRDKARRVGAAIRQLRIPVHRVLASEFCRTQETARLLDLAPVQASRDLLNATHAQHAGGTEALRQRAQKLLATPPPPGTNTVLVAHGNVFVLVSDRRPEEAGAAVVRPDGKGNFEIVAHVAPEEWIRSANAP